MRGGICKICFDWTFSVRNPDATNLRSSIYETPERETELIQITNGTPILPDVDGTDGESEILLRSSGTARTSFRNSGGRKLLDAPTYFTFSPAVIQPRITGRYLRSLISPVKYGTLNISLSVSKKNHLDCTISSIEDPDAPRFATDWRQVHLRLLICPRVHF